MRVTMLQSKAFYPDGVTLVVADPGDVVDVGERLALDFIGKGLAEPVQPVAAAVEAPDETIPSPIAGMNAKDAVAAIASLNLDELDLIPGETRKAVQKAIEERRAELTADDNEDDEES